MTVHKSCHPFVSTTHVVPPAVVLGMGCRKNKESEAVEKSSIQPPERKMTFIRRQLQLLQALMLKKEEPGLLALSEKLGVPFKTFSSEELLSVPGEFTPSSFCE